MTSFGRIYMARHGEPDLNRQVVLSSKEYDAWWAAYQEAGLVAGQQPPEGLQRIADLSSHILASALPRARETAECVAPDRSIRVDEIFVEAPLPAPPLPIIKLSPNSWGVVSRILWWLGYSGGDESRGEAEKRAIRAAALLIDLAADDNDVLLCAHGWFNRMIKRALLTVEDKAVGLILADELFDQVNKARVLAQRLNRVLLGVGV